MHHRTIAADVIVVDFMAAPPRFPEGRFTIRVSMRPPREAAPVTSSDRGCPYHSSRLFTRHEPSAAEGGYRFVSPYMGGIGITPYGRTVHHLRSANAAEQAVVSTQHPRSRTDRSQRRPRAAGTRPAQRQVIHPMPDGIFTLQDVQLGRTISTPAQGYRCDVPNAAGRILRC